MILKEEGSNLCPTPFRFLFFSLNPELLRVFSFGLWDCRRKTGGKKSTSLLHLAIESEKKMVIFEFSSLSL